MNEKQKEWEEWYGDRPLPPVFFGFEVDTFADLAERRGDVAALLARCHEHLVVPLVDAVTADRDDDYDRRTSMGNPGTITVNVSVWEHGRRKPKIRSHSATAWNIALEAVAEGRVAALAVRIHRIGEARFIDEHAERFELRLWANAREYSKAATQFTCHATLATFGGRVGTEQQGLYCALAREAMQRLDGCWGGIVLDRATDELAFERVTERPSIAYGLVECAHYARAYLWGNLLSKQHVTQLGGLAAVLRDAPFTVKEVVDQERQSVYLQATDNVNRFDDDVLLRVRNYLAPILPAPVEEEQNYVGPPLRIVYLP